MKNRRDKRIFHNELNKCINPEESTLPVWSTKNKVVDDLRNFMIANKEKHASFVPILSSRLF